MRNASVSAVIIAVLCVALAGCRSSGGKSGWSWGRKNAEAVPSGAMSGPELPSANAAPNGYDYNAAPNPSGPYYDQSAANPYQNVAPAGQAPGYDHVYAGPPAGGGFGPPPDTSAAYGAPGNPAGAYGAPPGAIAPQSGPYDENYGQPPANNYAGGAPPYTPPAAAYQPGSINPSNTPPSYPTTDPVATGAPAAGGYAPPADAYTNTAPPANYANNSGGSYQTADARNAIGGGTSAVQAEQSAADQYSAASGASNDASLPGGGYQPGNTGYKPGATGYSPPGVAPYQPVEQPNVIGTQSADPYYRPGSTSDYLPRGNDGATQSPATGGSTDRYGAPVQSSPTWPSGY